MRLVLIVFTCSCCVILLLNDCCVALRSAEIMDCSVKQEGAHTKYSVSSRPAGMEGHYLWSNESHHTLAHNTAKLAGLVLRSSVDDLITSRCIPLVNYELTSDKGQYYAIDCTTICDEIIESKEGKVISRHYIVTLVVVVIFVVVVVVLTAVLWKRNSNRYGNMEERNV